jgi:hypothetical protein
MGEKEWFGVNAFNNNNIGPLSAISFKSAANSAKDLILLGGRDSNVYYYDLKAVQDAGTDFTSYAYIGPYEMAGPGQTAMIHSLDVVLGETPGGLPVGADWQMRAVMTVASDAYSGIIGAMAEQTLTFDLYTAFGIQDRQPCAIASQIAWLRIDNLNADGSLTGGNNHKKFWAVERMYFRASAGGEQHGHNT